MGIAAYDYTVPESPERLLDRCLFNRLIYQNEPEQTGLIRWRVRKPEGPTRD